VYFLASVRMFKAFCPARSARRTAKPRAFMGGHSRQARERAFRLCPGQDAGFRLAAILMIILRPDYQCGSARFSEKLFTVDESSAAPPQPNAQTYALKDRQFGC
jgi:hypothetical protein